MVMSDHIPSSSNDTSCRSRTKAKRRGGYPTHKVMLREEARYITHVLKILQDHDLRPNAFISINPDQIDGETTTQRKKRISKMLSEIGTIFRRQNHEWHGVTTFEFPIGGRLHAHHAVHVPNQVKPFLKQWIAGKGLWDENTYGVKSDYDLHACPFRSHHASYMLKQSQWPCKPSDWRPTETDMFRRQRGNAFRGKRYHIPKATKRLISKPTKAAVIEMKTAA